MAKKKLDLEALTPREATVSQETLESTPARVITFLRALGTTPVLRDALDARGYTGDEHRRGWALLQAASGFDADLEKDRGSDTAVDPVVSGAIAELDAWDEDGFRVVRAALGRLHPAQAKVVLAGIGPSTGGAAVLGVEALLDRLDALAKSRADDDRAALATLAARGIDDAERKRLRALVRVAKEGSAHKAPADETLRKTAALRQKALVELRAWYEDWSEMARVAVKRRDRLIRLGLAKRKITKKVAAAANGSAAASPSTRAAKPSSVDDGARTTSSN